MNPSDFSVPYSEGMTTETIGSRIKAKRKEAGISQAELAKRVGLTQSAIAMLESGRRQKTRELVEIARVLGVSPTYLSNGKVEETSFAEFQRYSKIPVVGTLAFFEFPTREKFVTPPELSNQKTLNFLSPDPQAFSFLIRGSALSPKIRDSEYAVFSPTIPPSMGDTVLVQTKTGLNYIADFVSMDGEVLIIKSFDGRDYSLRATEVARIDRLSMVIAASETD